MSEANRKRTKSNYFEQKSNNKPYVAKDKKTSVQKSTNADFKKEIKSEFKKIMNTDFKKEAKSDFQKNNKPEFKRGTRTENQRDKKPEYQRDTRTENQRDKKPEYQRDTRTENQRDKKPEYQRGTRTENQRDKKPEYQRDTRTENQRDKKPEYQRGTRTENQRDKKPEYQSGTRTENSRNRKPEFRQDKKFDDSNMKIYDKSSRPNETGRDKTQSDKTEKDNNRKSMIHKGSHSYTNGTCTYSRECGGCNILAQSYEAELKDKQKIVESLLKGYCKVESIIGMKQPNHYRNKVHVVFDHDRKGNPISGVYEEGTHRVVAIDSCMIHNQKADEIIASIRGMLKSFKIKTFDENTGYGLIRHVMIRTGLASGEIMVVLVLASPILPSKSNLVKALLKLHPEITTIVINVNDKKTSMVLGDKENVIYGKGYIEDSLCGKVFRISPKSFYQVNPEQAEVIFRKAIEMAELKGTETVVDAYSGIGTIGIIASDRVKKVIGVELNKDAVKDAVFNAKRNEASNIEFYKNDAGDFMIQMAEVKESVDVVFMDPPRTGSNEKFMDALALLKPKKVVYISCNPITLERDLKYLTMKGYKAQKAVPVDMFPWTGHVETVVLLAKKVQ